MADQLTEDELAERDDRVSDALRYAIKYKRDLARQMRDGAADLESQARYIEQEAKAERWLNLEGHLEQSDVESLCSVSPTNLLG